MSKILTILVVVVLQVLCRSHVLPPMGSDRIIVILDTTTAIERQTRQKSNQSLNQERLRIKRQQHTGRSNNTKRTLREKDLALMEEFQALGWRETKVVDC